MMRIDSHQHFWQYHPVRDSWIGDDMAVLRADFLPPDLAPLLKEAGFDGCVAVQSSSSEEENSFHLQLAAKFNFIKGIVGWVDLQAESADERLAYYSGFSKMKGFRHVLQGEPQRDLMLQPAFTRGVGLLKKYNFTYDILIYEDQLQYIPSLLAHFPEQPFVIDHLSKPRIKEGEWTAWKNDMAAVARYENVCCKLSGMITEADWKSWKKDDFRPYLDAVVELFGPGRLMFGSDWPVCLVAGSYADVVGIIADYFSSFTASEQEEIFGGTACRFYRLQDNDAK